MVCGPQPKAARSPQIHLADFLDPAVSRAQGVPTGTALLGPCQEFASQTPKGPIIMGFVSRCVAEKSLQLDLPPFHRSLLCLWDFVHLCSHTAAQSKLRVGVGPVRPKKRPGNSSGDTGLLGKLINKESRSSQLDKASAAGICMQQAFIARQLSLATVCSLSLLARPAFQGDEGLPSGHPSLQRRPSGLSIPRSP